MEDSDDDDDAVGYGRPPRGGRFQKGQSGNPKGRPKGAARPVDVTRVLNRLVKVAVDGKPGKVPVLEAVVMQITQRALTGDLAAVREILRLAERQGSTKASGGVTGAAGPVDVAISFFNPAHCNEALMRLGIIAEADGRLRIMPWAVEAAMARNPVLTDADLSLISNSTLESEDVVSERPHTPTQSEERDRQHEQSDSPIIPAQSRSRSTRPRW